MKAILGKKVGMTSFFNPDGRFVPVTVIEAGPNIVTQVKTKETDGYNAVQIGFEQAKTKHTSNAMAGHFKKAGVPPMTKLMEFRDFEIAAKVGDAIEAGIFTEGEKVSVSGVSKGKGFQGVVRRHGFSGVGMGTHGQHNRLRAPGSVGASSFPSRVFKGMRMAGRMGNDTVKVKNLRVQKVMPEKNLILVRGAVPGAIGSYVIVQK